MLVGNRRNKGNSMRRREGVEKGERERVCKKERRKEEAPAVGAHHQFLIRKTPQKTNPLAQSGQEARSRLVAGSGWAFCLALFLLRFRGFYFWNFKNIFPEPWTGFPQCSLHCRKSTAPAPGVAVGGSGASALAFFFDFFKRHAQPRGCRRRLRSPHLAQRSSPTHQSPAPRRPKPAHTTALHPHGLWPTQATRALHK